MASEQGQRRKRKRRWWVYASIALMAIMLVFGAGMYYHVGAEQGVADLGPTYVAKQGPLLIAVTESGTIQSRDEAVIKNKVQGVRTIIYLIPEGTRVKKGQLLVQLDSGDLQDKQVDQQIAVENAQAALTSAQQNLAITKSKAQSNVSSAQLTYAFAQEDLQKYKEGEYPQAHMQDKLDIKLAQRKLDEAEKTFTSSKQLYKLDYISKSELDSDDIARQQADLNEKLAEGALKLLVQFTYPHQIKQLTADVKQDKMAMDRAKRQAQADIVQAQANLRAKKAEANRQQAKLAKLNLEIKECKIYAPRAGMVIYGTTGRHHWGNQQPLAEGQNVHDREDLIDLPTPGSMIAQIKVHEASVDKVEPGQWVQIKVDAYPSKTFTGTVTRISPLPDAQSVWLNPNLKVYDTTIKIHGRHDQLRTGMSCEAKILVRQYTNATYVPVQSVIRQGNQPVVFVVRHSRAVAQAVKLGLDNNRMVRIVSGVNPGQRVLLAPPLSAGQSATLAQVQHGAKIALKTGKGGAGVSTAKSGSKAGAGSGSSSAPTAADLLKKAEAHGYRPPTKKSIRARHADRIHHRGEAAPHHGGRPRHKALRHHQASHRSGHGKAGRRARERGK